jgi:hypothetical protein
MHPDQFTPDSHRMQAPDSLSENQAPPLPAQPEQDQALGEGTEATRQNVATPEPEGGRQAEAGNAYTGRQMDDRLKTTSRTDDDAAGADGDGTDAS